jgi:hypothetical protein
MVDNQTILIDLLMLSSVLLHNECGRREGARGNQTKSNQIKPAGRREWLNFNVSVAKSQAGYLPGQTQSNRLDLGLTKNHTILIELLMFSAILLRDGDIAKD